MTAALLVFAACSNDKAKTQAGAGSSASAATDPSTVTVQVDNKSDAFNFEAIEYFPNDLTVAQGSTVKFHSNFRGEPHTVTVGDSINKGVKIFEGLTPEQQNGPPPPEVQALKIPFVIPDTADFSDPGSVKFNQSAAQPCVVKAGEFAPGAEPCPTKRADSFDGTQSFFNSGLLKDDESFALKLADSIPTGTYTFICLFHGPEMSGKINVVAKGASAVQNAAAVEAAGKKQLGDDVAKVQPELDKARTDAKPGEVKAGAGPQGIKAGAMEFVPSSVSIPVGGSVTWNLSFHTVSFNAPQDATPPIAQDADGTWHFNAKTFKAAGFTPPPPPAGGGSNGPPASDAPPPPPTNVDGGTFDGSGFYNSGSFNVPGDLLFKLTFSKAGTFNYVCLIHPDMKGTVKVG
jgi:plastocyanin